ncbi:MAG: sensor histidine kinase, partial [Bacteroidota bacterium]
NQSLEYYRQKGDKTGEVKCYNTLATSEYYQENFHEAKKLYEQAYSLRNFLPQNDKAKLYGNLGTTYERLGEIEKAVEFLQLALDSFQKMNNTEKVASMHYELGTAYLSHPGKSYEKAISNLEESLELFESLARPDDKLKALFRLSKAHRMNGELETAIDVMDDYHDLSRGIRNAYRDAVNYKMQLDEEVYKNDVLEQENQLEKAKNSRQQLLIIGLFIVLGLVAASVALAISRSQSQKKRKAAQNEVDTLMRNLEVKTHYARIAGQDEERIRIAQDLHDGVGSLIATAQVHHDGVEQKLDNLQEENKLQFLRGYALIGKAYEELRQISQNIQRPTLSKFGLKAELNALAQTIRETGKLEEVSLSTAGLEERLDNVVELKLYRIIQELISNVLKHAEAKSVVLKLKRLVDKLELEVKDDGKGFDLEYAKKNGGMGLKNIESRIHDLGGQVQFNSVKGQGTTIMADIPLAY